MKVTLISHTQDAAKLLSFTKNTRLQMSAGGLDDWDELSREQMRDQIEYISQTIKSSWEFIDFTFMIEGVTRAFTHQFVRNRMGSYAQQTMRILDVSGFKYLTGPTIQTEEQLSVYNDTMDTIQLAYDKLIELGVAVEDARGVLPTNIHTNIVAKYNLRTLSDMMISRSSPRTQGEFRDVIELMYNEVIKVYPWLVLFLKDRKHDAAKQLDSLITSDYEGTEQYLHFIKQVDILRGK
ncbi:MAG: FAD-dependent thymidylate synthase [Lentisphaerae bacterium]|nr:FAD-dependent thymidylate synthase [Lentisphaerota bacterium]MCP4321363.1 FAD-dependent thymidylate synthase [Alteromonadales bacterium]